MKLFCFINRKFTPLGQLPQFRGGYRVCADFARKICVAATQVTTTTAAATVCQLNLSPRSNADQAKVNKA